MTEIVQQFEAAIEDEIVGVHVVKDHTKPRKRYLRSTLKSYTIDNVTTPIIRVADYNPRRSHTHIFTNDANIIVSLDNPTPTSQTSAAATPPAGASIHCSTMSVGFPGVIIHGPDPIWIVSITGLGATRVSVIRHIWCYDD